MAKRSQLDIVRIKTLIVEGMNDQEVADEMQISLVEVDALKRVLYQQELVLFRHKPADEQYADYRLTQLSVIHDLDELHDTCIAAQTATDRATALGALKAKAKIQDDILSRGQEMGVIPRAVKRQEEGGGGFAQLGLMSEAELTDTMRGLNRDGERLEEEYGDGGFLDEPEPEIYFSDREEEPDEEPVGEVVGRKRVKSKQKPPRRKKA